MATQSSSLLSLGAIVAVLSCNGAPPPTATTCRWGVSYGKSQTLTLSADKLTVTAKIVVGTSNPCNFYAEAELTSPTNRVATGASNPYYAFGAGQQEASAVLQVNYDDGNYTAIEKYMVEDDADTPFLYYPTIPGQMASTNLSLNVNGFVQISGTSWSPATTSHTNGSSTYRVALIGSNHCTGNADVIGTLSSTLAGMTWTWNGAGSPTATASKLVGIGLPGTEYVADFPLTLSAPAGGTVQATAGLSQLPSGCEPRSNPTTANLTVN